MFCPLTSALSVLQVLSADLCSASPLRSFHRPQWYQSSKLFPLALATTSHPSSVHWPLQLQSFMLYPLESTVPVLNTVPAVSVPKFLSADLFSASPPRSVHRPQWYQSSKFCPLASAVPVLHVISTGIHNTSPQCCAKLVPATFSPPC
jgi:hypothetical protein